MTLNTMSEGISLAKKLETESAGVYEALAKRYLEQADVFLAFAKENKRNILNNETTYFGVITDAIEGCFALNINSEDFVINPKILDISSYPELIDQLLIMEEKIIKFYSLAAEQAKPLMADVPRTFMMVAKKRENRKTKLIATLNSSI
jgi:hypothetical protein